ncbi:hypothetical protein WCU81_04055 [Pectobacterium atrosepticum]|uniref:hypothetical protein n=1 Tax=Pectobacterium atrosepticum TaxID=29471 RepID=UPI000F50B8F3|nr:hypothetical protein [Pectobacterium atrosepticum]MBL0894890.1 hypothetical protein [Pectobacterium atrosepticum]MCA6976985.1 hypothetical protein [Pectobacterium atrosepticum]MCH5018187.1 hypothetical protein [Pectobacterium atrosepticum]MCL6317536.1 hypothetical protein [Pectobacterium atrosepticum]MCL6321658.1 hypothetical protein [Pectobacterium atrosepticum]
MPFHSSLCEGFGRIKHTYFLSVSTHARQGALNRRSALTTGFSALMASLRDTFGVRDRCSGRQ